MGTPMWREVGRMIEQAWLFLASYEVSFSRKLMCAVDGCNRRFGGGTVVPAASVERRRSWSTKTLMRTPRYTTREDKSDHGIIRSSLSRSQPIGSAST